MTMKMVKESNVNTTSVPKLRPSGLEDGTRPARRDRIYRISAAPPFCDTIFRKCTDLMRQRTDVIF